MSKKHALFIIGLLMCGMGCGAWLYQIICGLQVTGLSNLFSWGLYMGTFEFFIGVSSGGMLLFSIAYLFRIQTMLPFTTLAAAASFGSVIAAGAAIMTDLGQPLRVLQMLLTPNVGSPLFWDVVVLGLYAVICMLAVVSELLPMIGKNRWRRGAVLDRQVRGRRLSYIALPFVPVMNAVTTLMFAVQNTREWWHSALLPADSMVVSVAVGLSFMMLVCLLAVKAEDFETQRRSFVIMARVTGIAILLHLCFTVLELVTLAWNGTVQSSHLLSLLFGTYRWLYLAELILPLAAMFVYLFWKKGSRRVLAVMNLLVILAIFIHRMMLLLPAFNSIPLTLSVAGARELQWSVPIASGITGEGMDVFVSFWNYMPTPMELCVNLLPFGIVLTVIAGVMVLFPVLSGLQPWSVHAEKR